MTSADYSLLDDEQLCEIICALEDRLPKQAAEEMIKRDAVVSFMGQTIMDKQSWLMDLPEWWAVVHSTYLLGHRGGEDVVFPLISALRWSDAFDCDWVTEALPSILGRIGPAVLPQLTAVVRDFTAGWSARDIAMKGMAAVSLHHPDCDEHVFRIIGERLMDEGENLIVRQLAGQILLDFRREEFNIPLIKFARNLFRDQDQGIAPLGGFSPEEVEWALHTGEPELWHYNEDWMRFYDPAEVQRRQKRWARDRLGQSTDNKTSRPSPQGTGGQVVSLWSPSRKPENGSRDKEPDES
jgi:hypothetical protein